MAGDFGCQAHRNAAGTVEQAERQARRQLARLFGRAVVVGLKIHRTLVDLVKQQAGDFGQAGLGVTHGGGAIAIAAAEVALAIDQRVALREVLRHAHQRVVGRLVTVGVKTAQHIAHHAGALDRLGSGVAVGPAKTQAHARHGIQNAPLHGLQTIAHVRQGAALDDAERVFQVSTLGVGGEIELVVTTGVRGFGKVENRLVSHAN